MRLSNRAKMTFLFLGTALFLNLILVEGYVIVHFLSKFW